ncbi:MAG: hypothetical protein PGN34_22290 [Methylobacterium frigidaeris]
MRRILLLGPPGSGKSTLARRLGARHGLPVFHLDQVYHRPGWQPAPPEAVRAEVERLAALPAWIIDGNYSDTLAPRFRSADTLIYLDLPTRLTMSRVLRRLATGFGRVRPDAAPGCPERLDLPFLHFALTWNRTRRARNLALIETFPGRAVVLRDRAQVARFEGVQEEY